jgi:hypothetical protein
LNEEGKIYYYNNDTKEKSQIHPSFYLKYGNEPRPSSSPKKGKKSDGKKKDGTKKEKKMKSKGSISLRELKTNPLSASSPMVVVSKEEKDANSGSKSPDLSKEKKDRRKSFFSKFTKN